MVSKLPPKRKEIGWVTIAVQLSKNEEFYSTGSDERKNSLFFLANCFFLLGERNVMI